MILLVFIAEPGFGLGECEHNNDELYIISLLRKMNVRAETHFSVSLWRTLLQAILSKCKQNSTYP